MRLSFARVVGELHQGKGGKVLGLYLYLRNPSWILARFSVNLDSLPDAISGLEDRASWSVYQY